MKEKTCGIKLNVLPAKFSEDAASAHGCPSPLTSLLETLPIEEIRLWLETLPIEEIRLWGGALPPRYLRLVYSRAPRSVRLVYAVWMARRVVCLAA